MGSWLLVCRPCLPYTHLIIIIPQQHIASRPVSYYSRAHSSAVGRNGKPDTVSKHCSRGRTAEPVEIETGTDRQSESGQSTVQQNRR